MDDILRGAADAGHEIVRYSINKLRFSGCIGCHSCAMACPFGAPSFNAQGKMVKCHGCYVRLQYGLQPACVRVCPTGALRMVTEEEYNATHTAGSIITAAREIVEGHI